jgi:tetratricopeptide (TPR) repeat protein
MKAKNIMVTLIAMSCATSCADFLNQEPQTALVQEKVYAELDNIEPTVLGLYISWRSIYKDRDGLVFQLGTDEAKQGAYQIQTDADQSAMDRYNGFLSPTNPAITRQWDLRWAIVGQAAQAAYALENNAQDPQRRNTLYGEACFIRAALTFELVQYWGDIPILDISRIGEYGLSRKPMSAVYEFIVSDLEKAAEYLPATQSDRSRATSGIANALLGKVYMSAQAESGARDYAKALACFEKVVSNQAYSLVADYADLFDAEKPNTSESVYEWQFNHVSPDQNQIQWQTGSRACANFNSGYLYFGGYDLIVPTEYCHRTVGEGGLWEEGDRRREASIRYDFTYPYIDENNVPQTFVPEMSPGWGGDELDPHCKKYEDPRTNGSQSFWYSGKNKHYIRLADVLLCQAECLNETGRTGEAVAIVNDRIRNRAWGGSLPADKRWNAGMSQAEFRTKILDERMRELSLEGWRRIDLIRTGNLVNLVRERNRWAKETNEIREFHTKFPIPLTEIKQNEDMDEDDQNPGYVN